MIIVDLGNLVKDKSKLFSPLPYQVNFFKAKIHKSATEKLASYYSHKFS